MRRLAGMGLESMSKPPTVDPAFGGRDEPGQHAHGGGFAGAVRPQESQHLAPLHREGDVVDGQLRGQMLCSGFRL